MTPIRSPRLCGMRLLCFVISIASWGGGVQGSEWISWSSLPPLPDREGFAGSFAGISDGSLLVAGGANFPHGRPWEGGAKAWYDDVFVLDRPNGTWRRAGQLPRKSGYGVSVTTPNGILCIGGSDGSVHHTEVFFLIWNGREAEVRPMPPLPRPCANMAGALRGTVVHVAGGTEHPTATTAMNTHWTLDLADPKAAWAEQPSCPGSPRILATAGVLDGSFYLLGGAALHAGEDGSPVRDWLHDGYRYIPATGWQRTADLPRVAVAAPSPAPNLGPSHLLILGGDDGSQVASDPGTHRGFRRDILAYHSITNTWTNLGDVPFSIVTSPAVEWHGAIVVPGGEAQPGVRTSAVWMGTPIRRRSPFGAFNTAALFVYLVGMLAIGVVCTRRNRNTDDYFKAGGRIPWWAAGISIYATMLSSLTFMAIPAKAYATDWTFFWANVPILLVAPIVIRYYLPFFRQLHVTSAYEYLERRFNLAVRLYGSASFILLQLGRQAIVLLLPSMALATVSDLDLRFCIMAMGLLCVLYTAMGGMEAVVWTDVAQTVVLLGGALATLILIVSTSDGGLTGVWSAALSSGKLRMFDATLDPTTAANAFWVIIVGNLFINLVPYTSDQAVVQRYLTTRDQAAAARAIWTNALLAIPSTALFFAIGTALFVYYQAHPDQLDPTRPTDAIFPSFIVQALPPGMAGLVIAGVFAAAQSTVSGSLNSVATALLTDFIGRAGIPIEGARGLRLARLLTAGIGIFATLAALVLADANRRSLWDTYNALVGLAGSGLAGLFMLGMFTRRATATGAIAGAVASAALLAWMQYATRFHFFLYAAAGIIACVLVGWLVSVVIPGHQPPLRGLTIHDQPRERKG